MELIDHFYKSLDRQSQWKISLPPSYLSLCCWNDLKNNNKKHNWPEQEGKDENGFSQLHVYLGCRSNSRANKASGRPWAQRCRRSEWSRKEVWVSWRFVILTVCLHYSTQASVPCWRCPLSHVVAVPPPQCPGWRQSASGDEGQRWLWLCLGHEQGHTILLQQQGSWCVALHQYRVRYWPTVTRGLNTSLYTLKSNLSNLRQLQ